MSPSFVFDAGAFVAYERRDESVRALVDRAYAQVATIVTSSAVVAQVWRGGPRQIRLATLLGSGVVDEQPLDVPAARTIGVLAAQMGAADVVDGHVALLTRTRRAKVVTSDPGDLERWGLAKDAIVSC